MTTRRLNPIELRSAIAALPKDDAAAGTTSPRASSMYVPLSHQKALNPNASLVVGSRGSGKTYWYEALQDQTLRRLLGEFVPESGLAGFAKCSSGFGTDTHGDFPRPATLRALSAYVDAADIWWSVIAWHVLSADDATQTTGNWPNYDSWKERIEWIAPNKNSVEDRLVSLDQRLNKSNSKHLILFDALDRTAGSDWGLLRKLLRGLLETLLYFRSFRAIRAKAFVRPDMLEDGQVLAFPDSSKVQSTAATLSWTRVDLFNLLWQHLGNNADVGDKFRTWTSQECEQAWGGGQLSFTAPQPLRVDESVQRKVFHQIAGPFMGSDRRRGLPYTWLPNHLGDAQGTASPRSFIVALQAAAEGTALHHRTWEYALNYQEIQSGVVEASKIRVREIGEDFDWVGPAMGALGGITVPCEFRSIRERWKKGSVVDELRRRMADSNSASQRLPPRNLDQGEEGIRKDLERLAIFQPMLDGRVNVPDVYRVGFQLGRRGGVKPVK